MFQIKLHGFGDASEEGCCSAMYILVNHTGGTGCLWTAESRIARTETSIFCWNWSQVIWLLLTWKYGCYSIENVRNALIKYPVTCCCLARQQLLYIGYKIIIRIANNLYLTDLLRSNRQTIFLPTKYNPADIGS